MISDKRQPLHVLRKIQVGYRCQRHIRVDFYCGHVAKLQSLLEEFFQGETFMLVLSRKIGETLKIGDDIEIQILDVNRGQVRIGIAAPKQVNIVRSELLDRPRPSETAHNMKPAQQDNGPRILRRRTY